MSGESSSAVSCPRYIDINLAGFEAIGTTNVARESQIVEVIELSLMCASGIVAKERDLAGLANHCRQHGAVTG